MLTGEKALLQLKSDIKKYTEIYNKWMDEYEEKINEFQARNEEFTDAEQETWNNKERFDEITKKYCEVNPNTNLIECKFAHHVFDKKFYNTHKENMKTLLEKQKNNTDLENEWKQYENNLTPSPTQMDELGKLVEKLQNKLTRVDYSNVLKMEYSPKPPEWMQKGGRKKSRRKSRRRRRTKKKRRRRKKRSRRRRK